MALNSRLLLKWLAAKLTSSAWETLCVIPEFSDHTQADSPYFTLLARSITCWNKVIVKDNNVNKIQMVFIGCGFSSRGQKLPCAFVAAVCKVQARKHYIKSLISAPKDKKAVSLKVVGPLYICLFMAHLPSGSRTLNWHLETIYSMPYSILLLPLWSTHLLLCLEGEDAGDWSKDLLLHQSAVIRHICDHCWTHKITLHG